MATSRRTGLASISVELVEGASAATRANAASPLKLLVPQSRGASVWAFLSSFGGGLVAGDQTIVEVEVGAGASCLLSTQSSTKVFRNPERLPCLHRVTGSVGRAGFLAVLPDPVQCFAEALYDQRQTIDLASGSSLVLLDWFSAGRAARGERWAFSRYSTRNEIRVVKRPVLIDAIRLDPADGPVAGPMRMGRFHCMATLALIGPVATATAQEALAEVSSRPVTKRAEVLISASPLREGAVIRLAGPSVEAVAGALKPYLNFVSRKLGDDPWARKW